MKISDILADSRKAYPSLEIVPPLRGITKDELLESIAPFMEFSPKYINVTSHRDEYEYREESDGSFSRHSFNFQSVHTFPCKDSMISFGTISLPKRRLMR